MIHAVRNYVVILLLLLVPAQIKLTVLNMALTSVEVHTRIGLLRTVPNTVVSVEEVSLSSYKLTKQVETVAVTKFYSSSVQCLLASD